MVLSEDNTHCSSLFEGQEYIAELGALSVYTMLMIPELSHPDSPWNYGGE